VNFLNVGPWELTVILIIAILLVGPRRMVEIGRTIGRVTRQLRRFSNEFNSTLQAEVMATEHAATAGESPQDIIKESPQDIIKSITEPFTGLQAELQATERETRQALENLIDSTAEPIQDELQAVERETRQALENAAQNDTNNDPTQEN